MALDSSDNNIHLAKLLNSAMSEELVKITQERNALRAENAALRAQLKQVSEACDEEFDSLLKINDATDVNSASYIITCGFNEMRIHKIPADADRSKAMTTSEFDDTITYTDQNGVTRTARDLCFYETYLPAIRKTVSHEDFVAAFGFDPA